MYVANKFCNKEMNSVKLNSIAVLSSPPSAGLSVHRVGPVSDFLLQHIRERAFRVCDSHGIDLDPPVDQPSYRRNIT